MQLAALCVELDLLEAVAAAQDVLEGRLQAGLADEVLRPVALVAEALVLGPGDAARPAQHVREERALRIAAARLQVDADTGERGRRPR